MTEAYPQSFSTSANSIVLPLFVFPFMSHLSNTVHVLKLIDRPTENLHAQISSVLEHLSQIILVSSPVSEKLL